MPEKSPAINCSGRAVKLHVPNFNFMKISKSKLGQIWPTIHTPYTLQCLWELLKFQNGGQILPSITSPKGK